MQHWNTQYPTTEEWLTTAEERDLRSLAEHSYTPVQWLPSSGGGRKEEREGGREGGMEEREGEGRRGGRVSCSEGMMLVSSVSGLNEIHFRNRPGSSEDQMKFIQFCQHFFKPQQRQLLSSRMVCCPLNQPGIKSLSLQSIYNRHNYWWTDCICECGYVCTYVRYTLHIFPAAGLIIRKLLHPENVLKVRTV